IEQSQCSIRNYMEQFWRIRWTSRVNGKDLSRASHEEAVEAFRSAKDPIVVQVLRRNPLPRGQGSSPDVQLVDVCTQTDITFEHIMALAKLQPSSPPVPDYLSNMAPDAERTDELEYEEVELCRLNSQEKLGLTLCYRTDDEDDIAIYVIVHPSSVELSEVRMRLRFVSCHPQINGEDVQNREEAVALLSREDCRNIVLLVARPELQLEEAWLDDEHSEFLEDLKLEMLAEQRREEEEMERAAREEEEQVSTAIQWNSRAYNADSHVEKVVFVANFYGYLYINFLQYAQHTVLAQIQKRLSRCLRQRREAAAQGPCGLAPEVEGPEGDRYQQLLELKCQIRNSGEYDLFYHRSSTIECSMGEQRGSGMEHELRLLNEELRSIELECQSLMQAHQLRKGGQRHAGSEQGQWSPSRSPARRQGGKLADINEHPEKSDKDSSSAYNTAESSRSTPLAMDRSPEHSLQRMISLTNQRNLRGGLVAGRGSPPCAPVHRAPSGSPDHSNPSESEQTPPVEEESSPGKERAPISRIPYLSPHRPHADVPIHARHYQSYMQLIEQRSIAEGATGEPGPLGPHTPEPRLEWKVKVRSDGTRYITKRPVRDRLLRERALKIKEERSGGMTTDDDAMSEMKMGRYWSKEERKQQLLRAKEQRRRREFMQRCRLESLRESPQSGSEGRKEVSIIELSQRKMMKKRNKKILDNWMTIQELMTHGAKAPEGAKVHNAFLSVTTV
uniref:PDZ domain containing ring finger 4 n=1 Tax=Electrophorus electricus TaxID=8005 RepID=A0A4W4H025_ELEEL